MQHITSKAILFALAMLLAAWPARGVEHVASLMSTSDETKEAFVLRVAEEMSNFTTATDREACGSLALSDEGGWSIKIMTSHQPLECEWSPTDTVPGYTETNESIHSHPQSQSILPRGVTARERHMLKVSTNPNGCTFSPHDMTTGAGYLVACGKVLHHDGRGGITTVNKLSRR